MADIHVERKGPSIWPWIIGLVVLALLVWVLTELFDDEEEEVVTTPAYEEPAMVEAAPEPEAPAPMVAALPAAEIVQDPTGFEGRTVSGETRVAEVVDGRAFWIEDRGMRLLVVLDDDTAATAPELRAGQPVRITDARVVAGADRRETLPGDARAVAEGEAVVLSASPSNVQILEGPRPDTTERDGPGTGR